MLLIEKKLQRDGYIVFFGSNNFQEFNDFYKACSFASKLENFVKFVEEAFAKDNKKVHEIIQQFRAF